MMTSVKVSSNYSVGHYLYGKSDFVVDFFETLTHREDPEGDIVAILQIIEKETPDFATKLQKVLQPKQSKENPQQQAIRLANELQKVLPLLVNRSEIQAARLEGEDKATNQIKHTLLNIGYQ